VPRESGPATAVEPFHDRVAARAATDAAEAHDGIVAPWKPEDRIAVDERGIGRNGVVQAAEPGRLIFRREPDAANVGFDSP
jgi:hypothetical protein